MINYPSTPSDLNDFPYPSNSDVQLFVGEINSGSIFPNNWKIWRKPKGSTMTYIFAVGGGAGGGGGGQGASGTNKGGGGGGGSGGLSRLIIPSLFLPDILYVNAGHGGIGDPARTVTGVGPAASAGWISYVSYSPSTAANNVLLQSSAANAAGGTSGGNGAGQGTGGAGATVVTSIPVGSVLGISSFLAGQAGTNGGTATSNGTDLTTWTTATGFFSGGTGGAGNSNASFTGGNITVAAVVPIQNMIWPPTTGGVVLGGAAGVKGNAGNNIWNPFIKSGGSGGGTNTTTGGDGSSGGIGCGGGGGAAGIAAGRGGSGGPGMVLIISW